MKVSKNGFVMRTAYAFTERNKRPTGNLDGCSLFWRFLFFGVSKVVLNISTWMIFVPIGYIILLGAIIWNFSIGARPVFVKTDDDYDYWWGKNVVSRASIVDGYRAEKIATWPSIGGVRILPLPMLLGALVVLFVVYIEVAAFQNALSQPLESPVSSIFEIMQLGVIALVVFWANEDSFKQSEFYQLASARWGSFKDRTCPVVTVVEE